MSECLCGRNQTCVAPECPLESQARIMRCAPSTARLTLSCARPAQFPFKQTASPLQGLSGHSQVGRAGFLSWVLPGGGTGASQWGLGRALAGLARPGWSWPGVPGGAAWAAVICPEPLHFEELWSHCWPVSRALPLRLSGYLAYMLSGYPRSFLI